ncbi:MAG: hypothetical protein AAF236_07780 [Verrucomicrobiota bacterium]
MRLLSLLLTIISTTAFALEPSYEQAPIYYSKSEADTPVTALREQLRSGELALDGASEKDNLVKLLRWLEIPIESQVLVYSKTSEQNNYISPRRPRAIYFSDDLYLGWVQGGDVELISFDRNLGMVFHLLDISAAHRGVEPELIRESSCLSCHAGAATRGFPGLLVRSVLPSSSGQPLLQAGSFRTDHSSPLAERWGGWYVTGNAEGESHLGNILASEVERGGEVQFTKQVSGAVADIEGLFATEPYPNGGKSDIVALMLLEHQLVVHNALAKGLLVTRQAIYRNRAIRKVMGEENLDQLTDTNQRVIAAQAKEIVSALLFSTEHLIEENGVEGDAAFQTAFEEQGEPTDSRYSLRDLRLYERLFKYRCSYLIYSDAFAHLPIVLKTAVLRELKRALTEGAHEDAYRHLSDSERRRILAILGETLPDWNRVVVDER